MKFYGMVIWWQCFQDFLFSIYTHQILIILQGIFLNSFQSEQISSHSIPYQVDTATSSLTQALQKLELIDGKRINFLLHRIQSLQRQLITIKLNKIKRHLRHPIINNFQPIIRSQTNKISILWPILFMYFLVACYHRDHITHSSLFEHVEHYLVLAYINVEFDIVVIFYPAFVHPEFLYYLYFLTYTN